MLSSISPSTYSSPAGVGPSVSGLQAQLDRYQKELSDCVNCDSAKTPAGKADIQAVSNKISAVKSRIEEITASKQNARPAPSTGTPADTAEKAAPAAGVQGSGSATLGSAYATVGYRLDVYA